MRLDKGIFFINLFIVREDMKDSERVVNRKEIKGLRRNLRSNLTPAEATLWSCLKAGNLEGTKWRRQFSVGNYILDFYCPKYKLCIELDGSYHYTMQGDTYDLDRTEFLRLKGIQVLRFENKDIWDNISGVLDTIKMYLQLPPG